MKPQCAAIIHHWTKNQEIVHTCIESIWHYSNALWHCYQFCQLSKYITFLSSLICNCSPFSPQNNRTANAPNVLLAKVWQHHNLTFTSLLKELFIYQFKTDSIRCPNIICCWVGIVLVNSLVTHLL